MPQRFLRFDRLEIYDLAHMAEQLPENEKARLVLSTTCPQLMPFWALSGQNRYTKQQPPHGFFTVERLFLGPSGET